MNINLRIVLPVGIVIAGYFLLLLISKAVGLTESYFDGYTSLAYAGGLIAGASLGLLTGSEKRSKPDHGKQWAALDEIVPEKDPQVFLNAETYLSDMRNLYTRLSKTERGKKLSYEDFRVVYIMYLIGKLESKIENR